MIHQEHPIYHGLISGDRYTYQMLRAEREELELYWKWWWENKADAATLTRPYTLEDSESILQPTIQKSTVDTLHDDFMFSKPLRNLLEKNILSRGSSVKRNDYRQQIVDYLLESGLDASKPVVVFTGGGYGAGKTSCLQWLASNGRAPGGLPVSALQGVDYCKQLLPEFSMVQRVGDGRASEICQDESRTISDLLFSQLTANRKSYGWDSSMSNLEATMSKINHAKKLGYHVFLIAVLTRIELAKSRAMKRAYETRRFSPPKYLEQSHSEFWKHLQTYVDISDECMVLDNSASAADGPRILLRKEGADQTSKIFDEKTLSSYVSLGHSQ